MRVCLFAVVHGISASTVHDSYVNIYACPLACFLATLSFTATLASHTAWRGDSKHSSVSTDIHCPSTMPEPHRFAGTYHATQPIPAWEKGSKLSDTSEDDFKDGYYDSSDVSTSTSSDTDDEPASFDADTAIASLVVSADDTPRKADLKGKGKQILPETLSAPSRSSLDTASTTNHETPCSKTDNSASILSSRGHSQRKYRPRAASSSRQSSRSSVSPLLDQPVSEPSSTVGNHTAGPAAQSFSDFTKRHSGHTFSSSDIAQRYPQVKAEPSAQNEQPLRAAIPIFGRAPNGIPLRANSRGIGRAQSAPTSVFGGPSPRTPSSRLNISPRTPKVTSQQTSNSNNAADDNPDGLFDEDAVRAAKGAEAVIKENVDKGDGKCHLEYVVTVRLSMLCIQLTLGSVTGDAR